MFAAVVVPGISAKCEVKSAKCKVKTDIREEGQRLALPTEWTYELFLAVTTQKNPKKTRNTKPFPKNKN